MHPETDLPPDVIEAINANRKVEAVKRLRAHHDIDLKEAKDLVDEYIRYNPPVAPMPAHQTESGLGRIVLVIILGALAYGVYLYFN